jgi:hypothetical protein
MFEHSSPEWDRAPGDSSFPLSIKPETCGDPARRDEREDRGTPDRPPLSDKTYITQTTVELPLVQTRLFTTSSMAVDSRLFGEAHTSLRVYI